MIRASLGLFYLGLCPSWTYVSISFSRLSKVSTIISSNKFSIPCSLSSLYGSPVMQVLVCLMLPWRSLKVFSIFGFYLFIFAVLIGSFLLLCLPNHWFDPLLQLIYCWFLQMYSLFQLLYFPFLTSSFLCFLISLLNFSLKSSILPLSSLSILITGVLNCSLSWPLSMLVLRTLGRGFCAGQVQLSPVPCLEPLVLALEVPGRC